MDDVRAALNTATKWLRATPGEVAAVRRYQSLDGQHERLNASLLEDDGDWMTTPLAAVVDDLDTLLDRAFLPLDVVTYRGVSDIDEAAPARVGAVEVIGSYLSTSLDAVVAERDFAVGPRPGVLRIAAPRATRALWVPPLGRRDLSYEQEVLFARFTRLRFGRRTMEGNVVVVRCEVVP